MIYSLCVNDPQAFRPNELKHCSQSFGVHFDASLLQSHFKLGVLGRWASVLAGAFYITTTLPFLFPFPTSSYSLLLFLASPALSDNKLVSVPPCPNER